MLTRAERNRDELLKQLDNVKECTNGHVASCPLHDDKKASLSISVSPDREKVLVTCFAGCDQQALYAKCKALWSGNASTSTGNTTNGKFEFDEGLRQPQQRDLPQAADYLNARGITLEIARKLGWGFTRYFLGQQRDAVMMPHILDGNIVGVKYKAIAVKEFAQLPGSSISGLYARDFLDANAQDVFVFEGPDDVALAMSYGYNATGVIAASSPLGPTDIDALKKYKRVYLVGDMDLAGRKAMDGIAAKLDSRQVIRVRLPGVKDIGELYKQDREKFPKLFRQIIRNAQMSREYFELDDLMTEHEAQDHAKDLTPYIVDRLVPMGAITMFFGEEKSGKSMLVYYLLKCIVNGKRVFGSLATSQRPVLYLDRENSALDIGNMVGLFGNVGAEPVRYKTRQTGCPEANGPGLLEFAEKYKPVIVLDSLTKFLNGADPFNPKDTSELFDNLLNLCSAGATVIIIHHATKADGERYANSHQIGANVSRAYAVVSEDRPKLHRVRVEAKLTRGAEPYSVNLIAFPVIKDRQHFGLSERSLTDVDQVVRWVERNQPEGCTETKIRDGMKSRFGDIRQALADAVATGRLVKVPFQPKTGRPGHLFALPDFPSQVREGNSELLSFPEPGRNGKETLENRDNEMIPF